MKVKDLLAYLKKQNQEDELYCLVSLENGTGDEVVEVEDIFITSDNIIIIKHE